MADAQRLKLTERLYAAWLRCTIALERKKSENGYIPPDELRLLVLVVIQLYMDINGVAPTAVNIFSCLSAHIS